MKQTKGFTLIELMIAVAIVAIIAAIAYPSYQEQARRTRRTDAQAALMQAAQALERYRSNNNGVYTGAAAGTDFPNASPEQYYALSFSAGPTANTYTLLATRQNEQVNDTRCGNFTLDQAGTKGVAGASATADDCWR
ncbi:MAG: type IV pilin protein [Candidatus Competibacteraceae bacterium]